MSEQVQQSEGRHGPWLPAIRPGICALHVMLALVWAGAALGDSDPPVWADVAPIFKKRCVNCHSELGASKGLRLDSYAWALAGSQDGPVLLAGNVPESELARRILGESRPPMPFLGRPLPPEELELILRWIEAGLPEAAP